MYSMLSKPSMYFKLSMQRKILLLCKAAVCKWPTLHTALQSSKIEWQTKAKYNAVYLKARPGAKPSDSVRDIDVLQRSTVQLQYIFSQISFAAQST